MPVNWMRTTKIYRCAGTADSSIQIERVVLWLFEHEEAENLSEVIPAYHSVSFNRLYKDICGNYLPDALAFQRRIETETKTRIDWSAPQFQKVGSRKPRDFSEIEHAVRRSRQHPTEIAVHEGLSNAPVIRKLRNLGYNVVNAGYHSRRKTP